MDREITIIVTEDEARLIEERAASAGYESVAEYVHSTALAHAFEIPDDVLIQLLEQDDAETDPGVPSNEAFAQVRANLVAKYGTG